MQNKKNLIILAAIIIIAVVIYIIGTKKSQAPTVPSGDIAVTASNSVPETKTAATAPKQQSPAPATATVSITNEGVYIISYENSGFKPSELEIKRGTSVRFLNNSTKAMRIASTDTTGNSAYPSLSQPKSVGKGSYYEYTFVDSGIYNYANQNNSADRGTIVVK